MKIIRANTVRIAASTLLLTALLLMLCPAAYGEQATGMIKVRGENHFCSLQVLKADGLWYVNVRDLATIGDLALSIVNEQSAVYICRESPFVILYTAARGQYIQKDNEYYVPLQEASVAAGIRFFEFENALHYEILRTPKDLVEELAVNVFGNSKFRLSDLYLSMGNVWPVAESSARAFAILSSFSLSEYIKAATGEADRDRYARAMASVIASDEEDLGTVSYLADIDKAFTKADKALDTIDWLFERSSKFYYWLTGMGWSQAEIQTMVDQIEFYGEFGGVREFIDAYSSVSGMMDLKYVFDTALYITSVNEAEESVVNAMQKVFLASDNKYAQAAASKVLANRFKVGAAIDVGKDAVIEAYTNKIDKLFSELAYSDINWKEKVAKFLVTTVSEYGFKLPDKADAVMYLPIYTAIQQDLSLYFYDKKHDSSTVNMADLRSVGLMYLKAGIAAYKTFEFDSGIKDSVSLALDSMREELNEILSYGECEYAPDYTNQIIIDMLDSYGVESGQLLPEETELFDETFWSMELGQSLSGKFVALFHKDGTFTARGLGSGRYDEGTYTYENGTLKISFWLTGSDCEFERVGEKFISKGKQPMQVGEDYYRMSPVADAPEFYEDYRQIQPAPSQTPAAWEQAQPNISGVLEDKEYYGRLIDWSEDTMTVELLDYKGRNEFSFNYVFSDTGEVMTVDISDAAVCTEYAWSNGVELKFNSIDEALNTEIWENTPLKDVCTMSIRFDVKDGKVGKILFLYAA